MNGSTDTTDGGTGEGPATDQNGDSAQNAGSENSCERALPEQAQARTELEGHVTDPGMPAGGVAGNQNALDKHCGGASAEDSQGTGSPTDQTETGPGKSEQAPGGPPANGNPQGGGQEKADGSGNGPAEAPGQSKPANDKKPANDNKP